MRKIAPGFGLLALAVSLAVWAPAMAAPAPHPVLTLENVTVGLRRDEAWGGISSGPDCSIRQPLVWRGPRSGIGDPAYVEAFQTQSQNLKATEKVGSGPYQVTARITAMQVEACLKPGAEGISASGKAGMDVAWRIVSDPGAPPLAEISTHGAAPIDQAGQKDMVRTALRMAFTESARALFADPALIAALRTTAAASPMAAGPKDQAAALTLAGAASIRPRLPPKSIDSVVAIFNAQGMGSGFLASSDGLVLTNAHVVGKDPVVKVRWSDGVEAQARVLRIDPRVDVALVQVAGAGRHPLPLKARLPEPGETVFAIGTPLEIDLQGTLSRGIVSAIRHRDGELLIQSDVSIAHGNSGGPLLDEKGNVIGMTVSGLENTTANLNFFIPVAEILKALNLKLGG
ncbi:MAG: hypothetical protein CFE28_15020 [Alphaproteobacteria bacterium PA2]|nr:MAG: hypothetical protein CFE28_15020 [Alphaproteobacteria bacterium PA2]